MLNHLKAVLAVAGGVAGVGGGAVALTLRKSNQYGVSTIGGGDTVLASIDSSNNSVTQETVSIIVPEGTTASPTDLEHVDQVTVPSQVTPAEDETKLLVPALPIQEEEKENCSIIDSQNLNDVFYNLIDSKSYVLVSCSGTNKVSGDEWSNNWAGLFPSQLFSDRDTVKQFKMTTERKGTRDSGTVIFSSEALSSKEITGKEDGMLRATPANRQSFLIKKIDLEMPPTENVFLILNENIEFLRQSN